MAVILGVTLWRIVLLWFNQVDLFMDEAQYWLWGQEPDFGYYSKPPLIGWVIRASVELGGSDAPFWVRLPGPIAYAAAGILISLAAARVWPAPAAAWAGAAFVTLPGVAVLAQFISTDDLLFPCFALALLAWLRLSEGAGAGWAVALGAAVGLGLMTKYAMVYFVGLAGIAWTLGYGRPIPARQFGLAAIVAALIFAPNIWWNVQNGLITLGHTAENAGWEALRPDWVRAVEFLGSQLAAFGPVLGVAYVLAAITPGTGPHRRGARLFLLFSLAIFAAVALQALIRHANANWAAMAFVGGTALAAPWLYRASRRWFAIGLAINLAIALALPLTTLRPEAMTVRGENLFERTMGVADLSQAALSRAEAEGLEGIAATDRMVLADLAYRAKGTGIAVYAYPVPEVPNSHYALTRPLTTDSGPVLYLGRMAELPTPCVMTFLGEFEPEAGPERIRGLDFFRLAGPCETTLPSQ